MTQDDDPRPPGAPAPAALDDAAPTPAPLDDDAFRRLAEAAVPGIAVVTRRRNRIVWANPALAELLGLPVADLPGRRLAEFRERRVGPKGRRAGSPKGERAWRRADGTTVWVDLVDAPLAGPDGEELRVVHVTDVTGRRAAEADRQRQHAWASALGEIRLAVLLGVTPHRALGLVCRRARTLLAATDAVVIVPEDGATMGELPADGAGLSPASMARVAAADGRAAAGLVGARYPLAGTIAAKVIARGKVVVGKEGAVMLPDALSCPPDSAVLGLPLRTPDVVIGVLCLARPQGQPFRRDDIEVARGFADQAAAALHVGELRADRERLRVLEDRERIARDLHDSVIQDLFATGMALDAVQPLISDPLVAERVAATIDQLDATIRQIRSTIFELETSDALRGDGAELLRRTVEARGDQLGFPAALVITGDLDDVPSTVLDHVLAVVSESLSNTARHARATRAEVDLTIARSGAVTLTVCDDGVGFDPAHPTPGSGLANMRRRAELLGARLVVRSAVGAGTSLELTVPALA